MKSRAIGRPSRNPLQTPLERKTVGKVLARQVTLVPILAGLGMADGVLKLLQDAQMGHLRVRRNKRRSSR